MISDFVSNIAESNLLRTFNSTTDILEASDLFGLHYQKCAIKRKKIDLLKERTQFKNVFVISNLSTYYNIEKTIDGNEVINISDKEFLNSNFDFNDSLLLLTNNNLAQSLSQNPPLTNFQKIIHRLAIEINLLNGLNTPEFKFKQKLVIL